MDLIDRLAEHKLLCAAPREELAWLSEHGRLRQLEAGDVLAHKGQPVDGLHIVLAGHISLSVDRGLGPQKMIEWRAGEVNSVTSAVGEGSMVVRLAHEYLALT